MNCISNINYCFKAYQSKNLQNLIILWSSILDPTLVLKTINQESNYL